MRFFKDIIRHIKLISRNIKLDSNEKNFIKFHFRCDNKNNKKKCVLIQMVTDYYYLTYYKTIIDDKKFSDYTFVGLWPYSLRTIRKRNILLEFLNQVYNQVYDFILFYKWRKLYRSIGIIFFEKLNDNLIILKKSEISAYNNYIKKNKLLDYTIKGLKIGDIIYDTYLRFRAQPTLFLKDNYLIQLIVKSKKIISKLEKLYKRYNIKFFFTSYSSYIHHGLPARFFLKKNIIVYSGEYFSHYNKKLTKTDYYHVPNCDKLFSYRKLILNNNKFLKYSQNELSKRFEGLNDYKLNYMEFNPYRILNLKKKIENNFEGVLFLQDFYDSPHDWKNLIFDDYYKWAIFTLNLIRKYRLKIAVKPHPNSWHNSKDSVLLYKRLKKRFSDVIWIDKNLSNKIIFKNIKYGISATGSILLELAYHKKKAISCGFHPGINFNFTINAKNKFEYKRILLNINKIDKPKYSKKDLLVYNFIYKHYNMDAFDNVARKIKLKEINFRTSAGLVIFNQKYENFIKKINL